MATSTVILPCLNEGKTLSDLLGRLLALPLPLQVIVVDDGSTDDTKAVLAAWRERVEVLTNPRPIGKGASIRAALPHARGEVVVIQDGDLEYFPEDLPSVLAPVLSGEADAAYGSRFRHGMPAGMALANRVVNRLLVMWVWLLFGRRLSDEATCYKAFRREALLRMRLRCVRFEFCPEVTAKAFRMGLRLVEVPIRYTPRSQAAGKKIRWTDAPHAFLTLWRLRHWRPGPAPALGAPMEDRGCMT